MKIKKNIALSDTGFVFDPSTGNSFSANPIGMEIIRQIREGKTQEQIAEHILKTYQTDAGTFEKDYHDFLNMLNRFRLTENIQ
ncbi:MAG: hypothetical protein K0S33_749 [Bacteroidetes bacterium]|jgi:hypothetical protein|nr:hypothetical protein [Bacteroidota bacterium]